MRNLALGCYKTFGLSVMKCVLMHSLILVSVSQFPFHPSFKVASSDESGMIIVWSNPVISADSRLVINEPG